MLRHVVGSHYKIRRLTILLILNFVVGVHPPILAVLMTIHPSTNTRVVLHHRCRGIFELSDRPVLGVMMTQIVVVKPVSSLVDANGLVRLQGTLHATIVIASDRGVPAGVSQINLLKFTKRRVSLEYLYLASLELLKGLSKDTSSS